ncbi:histidine triad protein HinT [Mycoplasma corogypsi]|uniref:histidine triad protein HinT n=1 Tax=Mycoplasma corogypsi TaxID=2106 RepID=UPI003872AEDD
MPSIFTKIINREIPANILYEDDKVIAIYDIQPVQEGHFLVIPKIQKTDILELSEEEYTYLLLKARELAKKYVQENNCDGFQVQINTGEAAGQTVFHTHVHVIPYKK